MNDIEFENKLGLIAKQMEYPRTPDVSSAVMKKIQSPRLFPKRLAWSLTFILILLFSLFAIPPVRAAIIEFIQIGVVRIFPQNITPTIQPTNEPIATPTYTPSLIPILESIFGETTLEEAQEKVEYPIMLPKDFGAPDYVFVQNADGYMTILVWMNPQQPKTVALSLHFIPNGSWAITKMGPRVLAETIVDGYKAAWAVGPYPLYVSNGNEIELRRLVYGNVLIWTDGNVTYRLETDLNMEEAIQLAESLEIMSP